MAERKEKFKAFMRSLLANKNHKLFSAILKLLIIIMIGVVVYFSIYTIGRGLKISIELLIPTFTIAIGALSFLFKYLEPKPIVNEKDSSELKNDTSSTSSTPEAKKE